MTDARRSRTCPAAARGALRSHGSGRRDDGDPSRLRCCRARFDLRSTVLVQASAPTPSEASWRPPELARQRQEDRRRGRRDAGPAARVIEPVRPARLLSDARPGRPMQLDLARSPSARRRRGSEPRRAAPRPLKASVRCPRSAHRNDRRRCSPGTPARRPGPRGLVGTTSVISRRALPGRPTTPQRRLAGRLCARPGAGAGKRASTRPRGRTSPQPRAVGRRRGARRRP